MNFNVWCLDDGYGDNKLITGEKELIVPSNYCSFRPRKRSDFDNNDSNMLDYVAVEFNQGKYLVGDSAMKQDSNNAWFGGENKHEDIGFPIILKACLGLMASTPSEIVDCLVMGLPVESDEDDHRHALLESMVCQVHQMKLTLGDGSECVREVSIKNLIIKKQPFGSLCDIMLNNEGNIIDKEIARGFNIIVDIGSRTLNVYTLSNLEPVLDLCFHTNNGMYTSYNAVGEFIQNKLGYHIPSGKLPIYMKSKQIKDISLSNIIDKAYEIQAYEIKKIIETRFINSWGVSDRIIFTGGGAELLKPWLSKLFINKNVVFLDRLSNARGLRKYGVRQMGKAIPKQNNPVSIKVGSYVQQH